MFEPRSRAPSQRRGAWRRWLPVLGALALGGLVVYAAYETGRSHWRFEIGSLRAENQRYREQERLIAERLVAAEARAQVLERRNLELEDELARRALDAELAALVDILRERRAAGVDAQRLAAVLRAVTPRRDCGEAIASADLFVGVPLARGARNVAGLAGGRLTLELTGTPARDEEGRPEAWYAVDEPVSLVITTVDGRRLESKALLPATQSVVVGDREYRLLVKPGGRRGHAEVAVQECAYP